MHKLLEQAFDEASTLPEDEQEAVAVRLLDEVRRRAPRKGKWAEVADRLAESGLLYGQSEAFLRHTREMRDGFDVVGAPED